MDPALLPYDIVEAILKGYIGAIPQVIAIVPGWVWLLLVIPVFKRLFRIVMPPPMRHQRARR